MPSAPPQDAIPTVHAPTAGVFRRLAAACYDALLLGAIWMGATLVIVTARGGAAIPPGNPGYQLLLLVSAALFFVTSWLRGGQTLGMRAWRLRVERESGEPLDVRTGAVRFLAGLLTIATGGIGLLWLWLDRDELTWHDRLAGTQVVVLPKERS
jgi:uncharacterized RDD family membrane protein YckC